MVKQNGQPLDNVFKALSDPTRRAIVQRLSNRPASVVDLASNFPMSLPAVSKHLKVLENAGLIRRTREGRTHWISLNPMPLKDAEAWVSQYRAFWEGSLDQLESYIRSTKPQDGGG